MRDDDDLASLPRVLDAWNKQVKHRLVVEVFFRSLDSPSQSDIVLLRCAKTPYGPSRLI
jgi:hypothetical protein